MWHYTQIIALRASQNMPLTIWTTYLKSQFGVAQSLARRYSAASYMEASEPEEWLQFLGAEQKRVT
jgi:hypothetical protein